MSSDQTEQPMPYGLDIQIDDPFAAQVSSPEIARVVQAVLIAHQQSAQTSASIVITDDATIQQLNQAYRGIDQPTDVLAFAANEGDPFVLPEQAALYLGDVIVSWPRARAQAEEQGGRSQDELALLLVHGTLHLLGYDHDSDEARASMWAQQAVLLTQLGYPSPQ